MEKMSHKNNKSVLLCTNVNWSNWQMFSFEHDLAHLKHKKVVKTTLNTNFYVHTWKNTKKDNIFNTHPSIVQFLHSVLYEKISDQIHQENGPKLHFDMIDTILKILFYPVSMKNKYQI